MKINGTSGQDVFGSSEVTKLLVSQRALIGEGERQVLSLQRFGAFDAVEAAMKIHDDLGIGRASSLLGLLSKGDMGAALAADVDVLSSEQLNLGLSSLLGLRGTAEVAELLRQSADAMGLKSTTSAFVSRLTGATAWAAPEDPAAIFSRYKRALDGLTLGTDWASDSIGATFVGLQEHPLGSSEELRAMAAMIAETTKSLTLLGEQSLSRINWPAAVGESRGLDALKASIDGFERSYGALLSSLGEPPAGLLSLPPPVVRLPAVEFFTHAELTSGVWATPEREEEDEPRSTVREHIDHENQDALEPLLAERNPDFVAMWRGAMDALTRRGPDWLRHFAISTRELFDHLLRTMAPEDKIRNWSDDPRDYSNGRPTRAARLRYIGREIRDASFVEFMKRDVTLTLDMLGYLQEGTHAIAPGFDPTQVFALRLRVESVLRFVLQASRRGI